jgi:hypothetical protein
MERYFQLLIFGATQFWNLLKANKKDFCYGVYNQYESFIYLDLMVKNREVHIGRYFTWWTNNN